MPKATILCPYHGIPEDIDLPERATQDGTPCQTEVPCGEPRGNDYRAILTVEFTDSEVMRVEIRQAPKFDLRYFE